MKKTQYQELAEDIGLRTFNTGNLRGYCFRRADSDARAKAEAVTVQAGGPIPQVSGPRGFRIDLNVEIRSPQASRNASIHAECMARILDPKTLRSAALGAGMTTGDDFVVLTEEISGDRPDGRQLRKRTIIVPFIINKN